MPPTNKNNPATTFLAEIPERYGKGKLAIYGQIIVDLRKKGYSYRNIATELAKGQLGENLQNLQIHHANIKRFLDRHGARIRSSAHQSVYEGTMEYAPTKATRHTGNQNNPTDRQPSNPAQLEENLTILTKQQAENLRQYLRKKQNQNRNQKIEN